MGHVSWGDRSCTAEYIIIFQIFHSVSYCSARNALVTKSTDLVFLVQRRWSAGGSISVSFSLEPFPALKLPGAVCIAYGTCWQIVCSLSSVIFTLYSEWRCRSQAAVDDLKWYCFRANCMPWHRFPQRRFLNLGRLGDVGQHLGRENRCVEPRQWTHWRTMRFAAICLRFFTAVMQSQQAEFWRFLQALLHTFNFSVVYHNLLDQR